MAVGHMVVRGGGAVSERGTPVVWLLAVRIRQLLAGCEGRTVLEGGDFL